MTYPEIIDFFENYIEGTQELPIKEYYKKLGINYYESQGFDSSKTSLGIALGIKNNQFVVAGVQKDSPNKGKVSPGDIIYSFDGDELTFQNVRDKFREYQNKNVGDTVKAVVIRNEKKVDVDIKLGYAERKFIFEVNHNPDAEQLDLRNAWMKNL